MRKMGAKMRREWIASVGFALAVALCAPAQAQTSPAPDAAGQDANPENGGDDIVVTANRREERAQDVPSTLQVFNGASLDRAGADGFADYLRTVPGVSLRQQGNGANRITLRGVANIGTSDGGNGPVSTTGLYLNDVPIQGASYTPDLALYDLERIEVLKGPQGTLYGEGAMGGAIKMILNRPDMSAFESKGDAAASWTRYGGFNWRVRGAINIPLVADRLALRVAGTYQDESGFVDNVTRGDDNQDGKRSYSIRAILGAQLSDSFSAEVLGLYNHMVQDDFPQIEPALGGRRIASLEDRYNEADSTLVALTLKNDFGFAELTSVTSNFTADRTFVDFFDFGRVFFAYGQTNQPFLVETKLKRSFAQEVRLVSSGERPFSWVIGGFYRDKLQVVPSAGLVPANEVARVNAALAVEGRYAQIPANGAYFEGYAEQRFEQIAFYGEGTYKLTDALSLTAGLRWFDETTRAVSSSTGYSILAAFTTAPVALSLKDSGLIPKFNLAYDLSDDHLVYAQAAKGFRSGVINLNSATIGDEGATSDNLWSYEVGSKNSFGPVTFNAAAFYINWKNIQGQALGTNRITGLPALYVDNAGNAEIYGFEAELSARVGRGFRIGSALGYNHSELTSSRGRAVVGEPLPSTPEWTASGFADLNLPVSFGNLAAHFDVQYIGAQNSLLVSTNAAGVVQPARRLPAYTIGNFRIGVETEAGLGINLFVENIWDELGATGYGYESLTSLSSPTRVTVVRPRTIGMMLSARF